MKVSNSTKILILRLSIFIIYLAIGTWVFQIFERESQHKIWKSFEDRRQRVLAKYNISSQDIEQLFGQQYLTKSIEWSYGNTFVFAITVITTIGKKETFVSFSQHNLYYTVSTISKLLQRCLTSSFGSPVSISFGSFSVSCSHENVLFSVL